MRRGEVSRDDPPPAMATARMTMAALSVRRIRADSLNDPTSPPMDGDANGDRPVAELNEMWRPAPRVPGCVGLDRPVDQLDEKRGDATPGRDGRRAFDFCMPAVQAILQKRRSRRTSGCHYRFEPEGTFCRGKRCRVDRRNPSTRGGLSNHYPVRTRRGKADVVREALAGGAVVEIQLGRRAGRIHLEQQRCSLGRDGDLERPGQPVRAERTARGQHGGGPQLDLWLAQRPTAVDDVHRETIAAAGACSNDAACEVHGQRILGVRPVARPECRREVRPY